MQPVGSGTDPGMTKSKTLPDDRRRLFSDFAWL
jgi:hypothetical protein